MSRITELDLSPHPTATPPGRAALRQGLVEAGLQLRNGEQLLLSLLIPVAALMLGRFALPQLIDFAELAPSVLALALWSSGFTAVAIATGFERRYGVLERLASTPLQRRGLVLGKVIGVGLNATCQLVMLAVLALVLGWRPVGGAAPAVATLLTSVTAMAAFVAAALLLAGRLRAEITLAWANVAHLALALGGGILVPLAALPGPLATVVAFLPTGALGEAWRQLSTGAGAGLVIWAPLVVTAVWAAVLIGLATKGFRWMS